MNILITTPTGHVGRQIIPELLSPEFSVRVITENPAALPETIREQVEIVLGSALDEATLVTALDGIDSLFWCTPAATKDQTDVIGHYERYARALYAAVRQTGTPRIVTISATGRESAQNAGPISGLHAMEEILNESGAAIRHLRCGLFMEALLPQARYILEQGVFAFPVAGQVPMPMVAAHDVADVALRWLVRDDWYGVEVQPVISGERLSFDRMATVLQEVLERPVQYREAPVNQYIQSLTATGASVEFSRGMVQMFGEMARALEGREMTGRTGVSTQFSAWAEKELVPLMCLPCDIS